MILSEPGGGGVVKIIFPRARKGAGATGRQNLLKATSGRCNAEKISALLWNCEAWLCGQAVNMRNLEYREIKSFDPSYIEKETKTETNSNVCQPDVEQREGFCVSFI
jgi:hypothetical protein